MLLFCPVADAAAPPTARRMDCSSSSRVAPSSLLAASLKAAGEDVAYCNNWDIVCETTGNVVCVFDSKRAMVGRKTPSKRVPMKQFRTSADFKRLTHTLIVWHRSEEGRKSFPNFAYSCGLRLGDSAIVNDRGHFCDEFNQAGDQ